MSTGASALTTDTGSTRGLTHSQVLALCLFALSAMMLIKPSRLLIDSDTYWHIVVGKQIWSSFLFPHFDEFSYTNSGAPWIAKEWLSQLLLSGAFLLAGWAGVISLSIATIALSFTLILHLLLKELKTTVAVALLAIFFAAISGHLLARPHIFVFPILIVWTKSLLEAADELRPPSFALLLLIALWANLHASFPIAPVLAAIIGFSGLVDAPSQVRKYLARQWALFLIGAFLIMGATPYGFEPLLVAIKLTASGSVSTSISEWRPVTFDLPSGLVVVALLGSIALIIPPLRNIVRALPIVFCGYLMVRHVRFVDLFATITPIVMAKPVALRFPSFAACAPYPDRLKRSSLTLGMAGLVLTSLYLTFLARPKPPGIGFPLAALEAARDAKVSGNVFNDYRFGGFLIFEGAKTFIDSRAELFIGGFMEKLGAAINEGKRDEFFSLLDKFKVTWALVQPDSGSSKLFAQEREWRRIYGDGFASVYVRDVELRQRVEYHKFEYFRR